MKQSSNGKVFTFPNIAIGSVMLVAFLVVFAGEAGLLILQLSILCTGGLGLVIWVPIAAVLGFVVTTLISLSFQGKLRKMPLQMVPQRPNLAARRKEVLREYIGQATERGISRNNMIALLTRNGWRESDIDQALAAGR